MNTKVNAPFDVFVEVIVPGFVVYDPNNVAEVLFPLYTFKVSEGSSAKLEKVTLENGPLAVTAVVGVIVNVLFWFSV